VVQIVHTKVFSLEEIFRKCSKIKFELKYAVKLSRNHHGFEE